MAYATQQDFVDAFGESEAVMLTNLDDASATAINPVPLDRALVDASALIDTYCGSRYRLPLSPLPVAVVPYCLDIARYRLDRIRSREDVRQRYEDAIRYLEQIVKGTISLGADLLGASVDPVLTSSAAAGAKACSEPPIDLRGY
jgi:phage gp36-like protein